MVSGYSIPALERLLAEAQPFPGPIELVNATPAQGLLIVAAVNALPSMLADLRALHHARESGALERGAKMLEEYDEMYGHDLNTDDLDAAAALRALSSQKEGEPSDRF